MTNLQILPPFASAKEVAQAAAGDIVKAIADSSDVGFRIVLTGGTVGIATLAELAKLRDQVDWSCVEFWWGDERFLPAGDADRNEVQAQDALLKHLPISADQIHAFPAKSGQSLIEAGEDFARNFGNGVPRFDLVLLGMGPDGHVASLFPGSQGASIGRFVVAEANSPKPPPERLSLSFEAINSAAQVWILVAGAEKSMAVSQAIAVRNLPAAKVHGREVTRWYLDEAAASNLTSF